MLLSNFDLLRKNYSTMEKTIVIIFLKTEKNDGTILKTVKLRFTKKKTWSITKNYET